MSKGVGRLQTAGFRKSQVSLEALRGPQEVSCNREPKKPKKSHEEEKKLKWVCVASVYRRARVLVTITGPQSFWPFS